MGTYEIHKNFGVCNKSEDENNFMKNERRNCNVSSCIVKSRVGHFAYSLDDVVASTWPVTVEQ
jgi:hypothetical protein